LPNALRPQHHASPESASAQAKPNDAKTGTLLFHTGTEGAYAAAPKVETDVAIHVTGIVARTRVAQTFHNPGTDWVEGVYAFPLPENAAVDHLWLRIGELVRNKGKVGSRQVVAADWVQTVTAPSPLNPNFGMNMPLMSSAFDTAAWLSAA